MTQSRIDKIKALAERGIDGEKQNAIDMLKKIVAENTATTDTHSNFDGKGWKHETYTYTKSKRQNYIFLPYLEFATTVEIKLAISEKACSIIEQVTGITAFQNWADKVTCVCDSCDVILVNEFIADVIYNMLCEMGVPVIHKGGDKANFGPKDKSMEDGTENAIFQFQTCRQYVAPDMATEILSAMQLPHYNCFTVWTETAEYWGRATAFDKATGLLTLTPPNPAYPAKVFNISEVSKLFRSESLKMRSFQIIPGLEAARDAAIARFEKFMQRK